MKIRTIYRIEGGILDGTEIEPIMAVIAVKYPHRKSKDVYIPPMKMADKETKTWHCCQEPCEHPDFEGGLDALVDHLMLHKGRLLRPWSRKQQLKAPIPAVRLPVNPWIENEKKNPSSTNEDRRFCVGLYIGDAEIALKRQGLEVIGTK